MSTSVYCVKWVGLWAAWEVYDTSRPLAEQKAARFWDRQDADAFCDMKNRLAGHKPGARDPNACHTCLETAEGKQPGQCGYDIRTFGPETGIEPMCEQCRIAFEMIL